MNGEAGFNHAFGMCRTNLETVGLWPNANNTKCTKIMSSLQFAISICTIIVFINLAQTAKLVMIWGDLNRMIDNISTANLPIAVVVIKMILFRGNKEDFLKVLGQLLTIVMEDWNAIKSKKEIENMEKNARMTRKMSWICVILGFGSVNGQVAVRVAQELDILPGEPEKRLPMVSSYFPYDDKPSPVYEITWFLQYTAAGIATVVYSGVYCLFVALVLHLRGQVANLRFRFENLEPRRNAIGVFVGNDFKKKIGLIVERHESLNRFAKGIESIFNLMFLAEILSCTVQICLQLFLLVLLLSDVNEGVSFLQVLFMMIYVMHVGTHVFICCYVAEKLREESLSICESAYNCQWYNFPARDARMLIFVMQRSEKPLVVTAGKFCTFSLRLYAQVLKTSGGYLSMLLAVKDRAPSFLTE